MDQLLKTCGMVSAPVRVVFGALRPPAAKRAVTASGAAVQHIWVPCGLQNLDLGQLFCVQSHVVGVITRTRSVIMEPAHDGKPCKF